MHYQFNFTQGSKTISNVVRSFNDELDALDEATKSVAEFDIHIWQSGHWIARVMKGNAPLNVHDRYASGIHLDAPKTLRRCSNEDLISECGP